MDIHPLISQEFQNQGDGLSLLHHFQFFILLDVLYHDLLSCAILGSQIVRVEPTITLKAVLRLKTYEVSCIW